jgi:hypothetical protein
MARWSLVFLLSTALLGACGSDSAKPDANGSDAAGGQGSIDAAIDQADIDVHADGATGGDAPSGMDSGPQALGACLGVCLETFFAECPRINMACVTESVTTDPTHWMDTTCYANGVKRRQSLNDTIEMITVRKVDGSVCYNAMLDSAKATEDFTDGAGNLVAHIDFGSPSTIETITCRDGSVTHTDLASPPCAAYLAGTAVCTAGTCSW